MPGNFLSTVCSFMSALKWVVTAISVASSLQPTSASITFANFFGLLVIAVTKLMYFNCWYLYKCCYVNEVFILAFLSLCHTFEEV